MRPSKTRTPDGVAGVAAAREGPGTTRRRQLQALGAGLGLAGVFPPLAESEWVTGDANRLAQIVLHGVSGTLTVKGAAYNGMMPPFKDKLDDAEMAALLTHIRGQFGNRAEPVDAKLVAEARSASSARTAPWNGDDELASFK